MKTQWMTAAFCACAASSSMADYAIEIEGTGMRAYYCTITVSLHNQTDAPLTEVNGHFFSYLDGTQVGRSKGASFLNVAPDGRAEAVFETPNAPCDEVTSYQFVIGACRIDTAFIPKQDCAALIDPVAPIMGAERF